MPVINTKCECGQEFVTEAGDLAICPNCQLIVLTTPNLVLDAIKAQIPKSIFELPSLGLSQLPIAPPFRRVFGLVLLIQSLLVIFGILTFPLFVATAFTQVGFPPDGLGKFIRSIYEGFSFLMSYLTLSLALTVLYIGSKLYEDSQKKTAPAPDTKQSK